MRSGTSSAVREPVPKLVRMSLRTMPEMVTTFGALEPSPGYGPAVSCGITSPHSADAEADVGVMVLSVARAVSEASPTPPNSVRARLRVNVARSKARPRSWMGVMPSTMSVVPVLRL
ncbi:hypothetical protein [Saccharothrix luteola]|uniref:hypothetical protein n=1 Tax=Saccharothrix luteola TaxID=2893018 RepID=UPI001E3D13A6|nr:hypothetical protein [Saccharothrix luteola]MCC8246628.1 hypothetical protein [Saccharothrix luteola]